MTGLHLHTAVIEKWMLSVIRDGGVDRYDDLHIDEIDQDWRSNPTWLDAGIEAYRLATELRDRHRGDLMVALAFSLRSGREPLGVNFRTREEFVAQFDWSPPSLYLLRPGWEPWRDNAPRWNISKPGKAPEWNRLDCNELFGDSVRCQGCNYLEFRDASSDEYSRTVYVAG